MYFGHRITPLTSHIRGHLLQLILPHMVDHTFMAFPIPLQTLWTPWTNILPLMFPISSLKTPIICWTLLLIPLSHIYVDITLKPTYIGMCEKGQIFLEFSLMWIRFTCLLSFHMPRYRSDLTLHYPIGVLYKEPLGYIEAKELRSNETIVHYFHSLYILDSGSLCPFGELCVLPNISFSCELAIERWRIEVVEAQVQDSVSPVRRRANRGCHLCNLWFV